MIFIDNVTDCENMKSLIYLSAFEHLTNAHTIHYFMLSTEMWQRVYQTKFYNAKKLNQCVLDLGHTLKRSIIDDAFGHQLCVINEAQLMSVVNVPMHVFM